MATTMTDQMCPCCKHRMVRVDDSKSSSRGAKGVDYQAICITCGLRSPLMSSYEKAINFFNNLRIGGE